MSAPRDSDDVAFEEERFIPVSFANWDGSNAERGARHTMSVWYWLVLPLETGTATVYVVPTGAGVLAFLALLGLVRSRRRRPHA